MAAGARSSSQWLITLAAQLLVYAQGIVVFPIVIRVAGEDTYGTYVLLTTLLGFVFGFWTSGMPYRYRRNLVSAVDRAQIRSLFEPQFTFQLAILGATSVILIMSVPQLERAMHSQIQLTPWLLGAWLMAHLIYRLVQDFFRFTLRFTQFNLVVAGFPAIYMALLFVAFRQNRISLDALFLLQIAAFLLAAIPFMPRMLREIGVPRLRMPYATLIEDLRLGYPITIQLVLNFISGSSDRYLISYFMAVTAVAQYHPAYQLAWTVIFFPTIGYVLFSPSLWRLVDNGERKNAERLVIVFIRAFLMVAIPFAVGALMMGPSILGKLATPDIGRAGTWVMPIIALAAIPYTVTSVFTAIAFAVNRTGGIFAAAAIGTISNLGLNLLFLPLMRTIAVPAAAALAGHIASCVYMVWRLRSLWSFRIEWLELARFAAASGIMAGLLWGLGYRPGSVADTEILSLLAAVAGASVVYFVALWLVGGFRRQARHELAILARLGAPSPAPEKSPAVSC